jgi:hypothetical protein
MSYTSGGLFGGPGPGVAPMGIMSQLGQRGMGGSNIRLAGAPGGPPTAAQAAAIGNQMVNGGGQGGLDPFASAGRLQGGPGYSARATPQTLTRATGGVMEGRVPQQNAVEAARAQQLPPQAGSGDPRQAVLAQYPNAPRR